MKIENMLLALSNNGKNSASVKGNKYEEKFLSVLDTELNSESNLGEIKKSNVRPEVNVVDRHMGKDESIDENLIELIASLFNNIKAIEQTQVNEEVKIADLNEFVDIKKIRLDEEVFILKEMLNDDVIKNQLVSMGLSEEEVQIISDKLYEVINSNIKIMNNQNSYSDKYLDVFNYRDNNKFIMKNELDKLSVNNTSQSNSHFERLGFDNSKKELELTFNKKIFSEKINIKSEVNNELNILNKIAFANKDIDISTNNSNLANKEINTLFNENLNEIKTNLIVEDTSLNEVDIEVKNSFQKDITQDFKTDNIVNFNINNKVIINDSNKFINDIQVSDIRSTYVIEDIVQAVEYLNNNNIEELSVKMNPKDLGEINIKLIKTKSEEKCIITLAKEESFNLVKENINEIKTHLSSLEINVKEISVEIRSDNQNDFSDNLNQHFNKNNTKEEKRNNKQVTQENERINDFNDEISNIDLII
ncbi:flagellar hook-length control protein FliK [Clostridioides difficile]